MKFIYTLIAVIAMASADDTNLEHYLYEANDQFTAKVFSEVVKENPDKSVVLSAFSVLTPLAQLALASEGASHDEILNTIGMPDDNVTKAVFQAVNSKLRAIKGVDLKMASRIYIKNGYQLNDEFAAVSRNVFDSDVKSVDFLKQKETADAINSWVEDQTNKKIKDLVKPDSLNADTSALLVNALYFKGTWKDQFEAVLTTDRDFHISKEKTVKVPTMFRSGKYLYAESEELNAKLLEIPYQGNEASFLIVLPNDIDGLKALEEKIKNPAALATAVKQLRVNKVDVYLPKFKIETETNLKILLEKINIKKLFSPVEANLVKLLKDQTDSLYISDAVQKAFIEINEEGAEAAAANVFGIVATSLLINPSPTILFKADHPFVYAIKQNQNILFNGVYIS